MEGWTLSDQDSVHIAEYYPVFWSVTAIRLCVTTAVKQGNGKSLRRWKKKKKERANAKSNLEETGFQHI